MKNFNNFKFASALTSAGLLCALSSACVIEEVDTIDSDSNADQTTGETTPGDGDGDAPGDGDGDAPGDGDGDAPGDGDGDAPGDGDGDAPGDGDGDPATGICPGSEDFCTEAESHCGNETELEICQYLEEDDCIAHFVADCEVEVGFGSMCVEISPTEAGCTESSVSFSIPDLCADPGLALVGDATCYPDVDPIGVSVAQAMGNTDGGVYFDQQVPVGSGFSTQFTFVVENPGGINDGCGDGVSGADGMALVLHDEEELGSLGGGLGYEGILNTVAIEFDTFCNPENSDPSSNHVGIMLDGVVSHIDQPTADVPGNFEDGQTWYAWVDYDGSTIDVYVSQDPNKPDMPNLSGAIDVAGTVGTNVTHIGFTGATGAAWENFVLTSWDFQGL